MQRQLRFALIALLLPACWLGMQLVHELGHAVAASFTGGTVERIVLHPLAISRTDVSPNPHPLIVCWSGPIAGVVVPLLGWGVLAAIRSPETHLARFFAGFCLIANRAYLSVGTFDRIGDSGDLLKLGTPTMVLWLFGLVTIPVGFWIWHGQGGKFGLGGNAEPVHGRSVWIVGGLLAVILTWELMRMR